MTLIDFVLIVLILTGASCLMYRSFIKKKSCASCNVAGCQLKKIKSISNKKSKNNLSAGIQ
jgi:hypothetical protein